MRIAPVRHDTFAALGLLAGAGGLNFLNSGANAALPALERSSPLPYTGTYWLR